MKKITLCLLSVLIPTLALASSGAEKNSTIPEWLIAPFGVMLLAIAILPLSPLKHWWESNRNKLLVSLLLGIPTAFMFWLMTKNGHALEHTGKEYIAFIFYVGAFVTVTGGIWISGDIQATPLVNVAIILVGIVLASLITTAGAAFLITPFFISTNKERKYQAHAMIFITFTVANCAGLLLPPADPPLFLGFLRGVPFDWMLFNLWKPWLFVNGCLLGAYLILDCYFYYWRESKEDLARDVLETEPTRIRGWKLNIPLIIILVAIIIKVQGQYFPFDREVLMGTCAVISYFGTPKNFRKGNGFSFDPFLEVSALFVGIFLTMIPALQYVVQVASTLGIDTTSKFYFTTGGLSGVLDNAPSYLLFLEIGKVAIEGTISETMVLLKDGYQISAIQLKAISMGAVFFGAMTYIGNAPNFLIKSLAEKNGIKMPSFFGYIKWSLAILLPILIANYLIFLT